jgi:hemoglobin
MTQSQSESLYDRIGGAEGVSDLVVEFYERVLHDEELAPFFHGVRMDHLRHMQHAFFTLATGGPIPETDFELKNAHIGRHIGEIQYRRFVGHLLETLEAMDLEPNDIDQVVSRLALERDNVVDDAGNPD